MDMDVKRIVQSQLELSVEEMSNAKTLDELNESFLNANEALLALKDSLESLIEE